MKNQIVKTSIITFLLSTSFFAQEDDILNNNCPSLFTHSKIRITTATITRYEVVDSSEYTTYLNLFYR